MIVFSKFATFNFFKIFAFVTVSGRPPLSVIITAQPLADASKLVLPNGSSHREHATAILVCLNILRTLLWLRKPRCLRFMIQYNFFSFSSPITFAFQFGNLRRIF